MQPREMDDPPQPDRRERKHPRLRKAAAIGAVALAAAFSADRAAGKYEAAQLSHEVAVEVLANPNTQETIVFLPGFMNSGSKFVLPFKDELQKSKNTLVVNYPEGSFEPADVYEKITAVMEARNLREPAFMVESMGTKVLVDFLRLYQMNGDVEKFGKISTLVLDAPVFSPDTLPPDMQRGAWIASTNIAKFSWLVNHVIKPYVMAEQIPPNEGNAPPALVPLLEPNRQHMIYAPMPGVAEQAGYMLEEPPTATLGDIAEKVYIIYAPKPENDGLIDYETSLAEGKAVFGADNVTSIIDVARKPGSHGLTGMYPDLAISLLTGKAA